jgi:hypothetical protein
MTTLETKVLDIMQGNGRPLITFDVVKAGTDAFNDLVDTFNKCKTEVNYEDLLVIDDRGFTRYRDGRKLSKTQALLMVVDHTYRSAE